MTPEEHAKRLRHFDVAHLLQLVELEACRSYDGHWTMLRFSAHYKVAFGTPDITFSHRGYVQVLHMPAFPTLKEALIAALVTGQEFDDYFHGDPHVWEQEEQRKLLHSMWEEEEREKGATDAQDL